MLKSKIADSIYSGGKILTMDKDSSIAEAMAVREEKVIAMGPKEEIFRLKVKSTRIVDLKGGTLLPGLIDSHLHMVSLGRSLDDVLLYGTKSIAEIISSLREKMDELPPDIPLIGRGDCWEEASLMEGRLPNRFDLDKVDKNRQVMITDVNKTIINSFTLKKIPITRDTPDPEGGLIGRDSATGEPDGIFYFSAKGLTPLGGQSSATGSSASPEEAIKKAQAFLIKLGITGVVDAGVNMEVIEVYLRLARAGELKLRVTAMPQIALLNELKKAGLYYGFIEGRLRIGSLKLHFDPFIMHKTAYLYQAYENEPYNRGVTNISYEELQQKIAMAFKGGWPVGIHVTGDRGMDLVMKAFKNVCKDMSSPTYLNSVIHAYLPTQEALSFLKEMRIAVALQPPFIQAWGETLRKYIGEKRASHFIPLRTFLKQGIIVGGGSDASITSPNPFLGIYAAVSRKTLAGRPIGPEETISLENALRIYTDGSAYLSGTEKLTGSLEIDKLADMIVVEGDILNTPIEKLKDIKVKTTIIGGEIVEGKNEFRRKDVVRLIS